MPNGHILLSKQTPLSNDCCIQNLLSVINEFQSMIGFKYFLTEVVKFDLASITNEFKVMK